MLGISARHVFCCDIYNPSKTFCETNFDVETWFTDVHGADFRDTAPYVDFFSAGFPCQPYSSEGAKAGSGDARAAIIVPILAYIRSRKPKAVCLENVKGFMQAPHAELRDLILSKLESAGYVVKYKILNSMEFGVAQNRERVYIVGIRDHCPGATSFTWPTGCPMPPLKSFLKDSGIQPRMTDQCKDRVTEALKAIKTDTGKNPFKVSFVLNTQTGRGPVYREGFVPTITRQRGATPSYLGST